MKYYAIAKGNGVLNKIVTSWEECKWLTQGNASVFKSFKTLEEAEKYLASKTIGGSRY